MQEKLDLELDLFRKVRKKLKDEFCGSERGTHKVKKYEDRWEFYRKVFRDEIDRINKPEFTATEVRDESRGIGYRVVVFSGSYRYSNEPKIMGVLREVLGMQFPSFCEYENRTEYLIK